MPLRATHTKAFGPVSVGTAISAAWTPASGRRVRLLGGAISLNALIATDVVLHLLNGTAAGAGTVASLEVVGLQPSVPFDLGDGVSTSTLDMPLGIRAAAGLGTVVATFVGREERI